VAIKNARGGRRRSVLAFGTLLGLGSLMSAALFTDSAQIQTWFDGAENTFDIVAAGSTGRNWAPADDSWVQADVDPYVIDIAASDSGSSLPPGGALHVRIAVKNNSPAMPAEIQLTIQDPDPLGAQIDPDSGRFLELFDQLRFTVTEGEMTLIDAVSGEFPDDLCHVWDVQFAAGEFRVLNVEIALPAEVDNRWQRASTRIQFSFEAVNS
jgi:hypothetical protein